MDKTHNSVSLSPVKDSKFQPPVKTVSEKALQGPENELISKESLELKVRKLEEEKTQLESEKENLQQELMTKSQIVNVKKFEETPFISKIKEEKERKEKELKTANGNIEKLKSENETKDKNVKSLTEKSNKLAEGLEKSKKEVERIGKDNQNLTESNEKLTKENKELTRKLEGISKTLKLPQETIQKLAKKSEDDENTLNTYLLINKELKTKIYDRDCEIDRLKAELEKCSKSTEIEDLKKNFFEQINNLKQEKESEIANLRKEKEQELLNYKIRSLQEKDKEIAEIKSIAKKEQEELVAASRKESKSTKESNEGQEEELNHVKLLLQQKDQEIETLKKTLFEINEGLHAQISLNNEELEIEKELVRKELQEKNADIQELMQSIENLEKDAQKAKLSQESAQKKIEELTKSLQEEVETHKKTEDEIFFQNQQKTKLIQILENDNAKERLRFEAEIGRLGKEIDVLKARIPNNNSLDITGTSSVEDDERRFREAEEKYKHEIKILRQELENNRISNRNLQEQLENCKSNNEEKIVNISNCNSPMRSPSRKLENRISITRNLAEKPDENFENQMISRTELPSIIENKVFDNDQMIMGGEHSRKRSSFQQHRRNKSSNVDYQELYANFEELKQHYENLQEEFSILSTKMREIEDNLNFERNLKQQLQDKIDEASIQMELMEEEVKKYKREYLRETQEKLKYLSKIRETENKIETLELEKRELKEANDQITKTLSKENEELKKKLEEINDKESECSILEHDLDKEELEKANADLEKSLALLKQENEKVLTENKGKVEALKAEVEAKNIEIAKEKNNFQQEIEELKKNVMNLERDLKKLTVENRDLKQANERYIENLKEMEERARIDHETVEETKKNINRLEELLSDNKNIEGIALENHKLVVENDKLKKEIGLKNNNYQLKQEEAERFSKELEVRQKEIEEKAKEIESNKNEFSRKNQEISELKRIIEEQEKEIVKIKIKMESELNDKDKEFQEKLKEIDRKYQETLEGNDKKLMFASNSYEITKSQDLTDQDLTITKLNEEISSLKQEISNKTQSLEQKTLELKNIEKEIAHMKQLSATTTRNLASKDSEISLLKQEITQMQNNPNGNNSSLKAELEAKTKEIFDLKQNLNLKEQDLIQTKKELESKNEAIQGNAQMEKILNENEQKINELQERELRFLQQNKQKLEELTKLNKEIQIKYEESVQKYTKLSEEHKILDTVFQAEMKEKRREEAQFFQKLILLNNYEILRRNEAEYRLENNELKGKLKEYETKIKECETKTTENSKMAKELKLLKANDISVKMGLEMIKDQCMKLLTTQKQTWGRELVRVERKLTNFKRIFSQIYPLLTALGSRLSDPMLKEKKIIVLLMQAIMSQSKEQKVGKIMEFNMSPEKNIKETPITMKSTADASTVKKKEEAALVVGNKSLEMIQSLDDILEGKVCFLSNKKVFDIMERNLVNSWRFFEILQEVLVGFKGLIIENVNHDSKNLGDFRRIYEGLIEVLQRKNEEFQVKVKNCKELTKKNQGRSEITNEFIKNFEFWDNLVGTIHARKGELKELTSKIQNHVDFCFKNKVFEEMNKVFEKNIKENKVILEKMIKN